MHYFGCWLVLSRRALCVCVQGVLWHWACVAVHSHCEVPPLYVPEHANTGGWNWGNAAPRTGRADPRRWCWKRPPSRCGCWDQNAGFCWSTPFWDVLVNRSSGLHSFPDCWLWHGGSWSSIRCGAGECQKYWGSWYLWFIGCDQAVTDKSITFNVNACLFSRTYKMLVIMYTNLCSHKMHDGLFCMEYSFLWRGIH